MRKGGPVLVLLFVVLVLFSSFVNAQEDSGYVEEINSAMACLDSRVAGTSISLQEAVFSALAGTLNNKVENKINAEKSSSAECWPKSGCKVKVSAQAALAEFRLGKDITGTTDWLKTKTGVSSGLTWYLQITIDNNLPGTCVVNYDNSDNTVSIDEDMKLSGSAGSCFSVTSSGYWLKIKDSCVEKEFSIQCHDGEFGNFKTNLLYEKATGGIVYISTNTHSAAKGAWTTEEVSAKCFKEGNVCDYEASLWAVLALYASGDDVSEFGPYLRALSFDNERYFPSAFLVHILEGGDEHYSNIIEKRQFRPEGGFWQMVGSPYGKFYDTALAVLSLGGADDAAVQEGNTLGYLFDKQDANGCWNSGNIRDTAFIIWASGWLRSGGGEGIVAVCDGVAIDGDEVCDGENLGENDCTTIESAEGQTLIGGNLSCASDCMSYDVNECITEDGSDPEQPGDIVPNACNSGRWYVDADSSIDTRTERGYCHLEEGDDWPRGCCPGGFECKYEEGEESESICVSTGGGYDPDSLTDCELGGHYCVPGLSACVGASGQPLDEAIYRCVNPTFRCCTVDVSQSSCNDVGGIVCRYGDGEVCSEDTVDTSDGSCCLATCVGTSSGCVYDNDCGNGEVCDDGVCVFDGTVTPPPEPGESNLWIWIVILLILIVLVIVAIIYKDKIRVWWFKFKKKPKTSKVERRPPPGVRRPVPRFTRPEHGRRPPMRGRVSTRAAVRRKPSSEKEKEMDDTLKKLKEMSK